MANAPLATTVRILDQEYRVRADDEDPEFVQDCAKYVDGTMRSLATRMATGTQLQVAVMSALNIAEELLRERRARNGAGTSDELENRVRAIVDRLEKAMPAKAPRVPAAAVARAGAGG